MSGRLTIALRQPESVIDSPWGWKLQKFEEDIKKNEATNLEARWHYGKELVGRRGEDKQLPHGTLNLLAARDGISRSEIGYRMRFATAFPTRRELATAVASFPTWRDLRAKGLPKTPKAQRTPDPKVIAEGVVTLRRVLKDIRAVHPTDWGEPEVRAFDELKAELMRIQDEINSAQRARGAAIS